MEIETKRLTHFHYQRVSAWEKECQKNDLMKKGIIEVRYQLLMAKSSSNPVHEIDRAINNLGKLLI